MRINSGDLMIKLPNPSFVRLSLYPTNDPKHEDYRRRLRLEQTKADDKMRDTELMRHGYKIIR